MKKGLGVFLLLASCVSWASIPVEGTFDATRACPGYLSKNKQTNPDNFLTQTDTRYLVVEVNKLETPSWFRIQRLDNPRDKRWVSGECGISSFHEVEGGNCQLTPGLADDNVLALSWLPAFCQTYGYEKGKPECLNLTKDNYAASHLILHGLWPNQTSCGQNYGFCGVEAQASHCDYSPLVLSDPVSALLSEMMPSFAEGSCLERHEWNKHGSCQTLDIDQYFDLAARFSKDFSQTPLGEFIAAHVGQQVALTDLKQAVAESFGEASVSKVYFGCKRNLLIDVYVHLGVNLNSGATLDALIKQAPPQKMDDACKDTVMISDFTG